MDAALPALVEFLAEEGRSPGTWQNLAGTRLNGARAGARQQDGKRMTRLTQRLPVLFLALLAVRWPMPTARTCKSCRRWRARRRRAGASMSMSPSRRAAAVRWPSSRERASASGRVPRRRSGPDRGDGAGRHRNFRPAPVGRRLGFGGKSAADIERILEPGMSRSPTPARQNRTACSTWTPARRRRGRAGRGSAQAPVAPAALSDFRRRARARPQYIEVCRDPSRSCSASGRAADAPVPDLVGLRHGEGDVRAPAATSCKQGDKPAYIEYQGCHAEYEGQGKPLVARYRLDGTHAAEAEDCAGATASSLCALCAAAGSRRRIPGWMTAMPGTWCSRRRKRCCRRARSGRAYRPSISGWSSTRGALTRRYFTATESASENRNISVYSGSFQ